MAKHAAEKNGATKSSAGQPHPLKDQVRWRGLDDAIHRIPLAAFRRQKEHALLKEHGFMFENPTRTKNAPTGMFTPWYDERNTRHTYAPSAL